MNAEGDTEWVAPGWQDSLLRRLKVTNANRLKIYEAAVMALWGSCKRVCTLLKKNKNEGIKSLNMALEPLCVRVRDLTFRWLHLNGFCSKNRLPIEPLKAADMSLETKFDHFHSFFSFWLLVSERFIWKLDNLIIERTNITHSTGFTGYCRTNKKSANKNRYQCRRFF